MNNLNFKNRNAQSGFTLIELIVVIVILGILAATALPKFVNMGGDARFASLNAAKGALSATAAMAHGKYKANTTGTPLPSMAVEGGTINFPTLATNLHGYPVADAVLAPAAGLDSDFTVIAAGNTPASPATSPLTSATQIAIVPTSIANTATAAACYVLYTEPTAVGQPAVVTVVGSATACE